LIPQSYKEFSIFPNKVADFLIKHSSIKNIFCIFATVNNIEYDTKNDYMLLAMRLECSSTGTNDRQRKYTGKQTGLDAAASAGAAIFRH
jgi:hypothetical protein